MSTMLGKDMCFGFAMLAGAWARVRDFDFHSVVRTMGYSPWDQKIESAQKIHASRGCCEMHGNQF